MDYIVKFNVRCGILRGLLRMGVMRPHAFECKLPLTPLIPRNVVDEAIQMVRGYLIGARYAPSPLDKYVTAQFVEIRGEDGNEVPFEDGLEVKLTKEQIYKTRRK